jgi:hypothetical protein
MAEEIVNRRWAGQQPEEGELEEEEKNEEQARACPSSHSTKLTAQ